MGRSEILMYVPPNIMLLIPLPVIAMLRKMRNLLVIFTKTEVNYYKSNVNSYIIIIKTHVRVSAAKKAVWHTSVLFTGTAKLPFSTPCISITTGLISMKFTYFIPYIYVTLHTKFERNRPSRVN